MLTPEISKDCCQAFTDGPSSICPLFIRWTVYFVCCSSMPIYEKVLWPWLQIRLPQNDNRSPASESFDEIDELSKSTDELKLTNIILE